MPSDPTRHSVAEKRLQHGMKIGILERPESAAMRKLKPAFEARSVSRVAALRSSIL
ncbi:hypothetical protein [Methanothrix sp.]|uniref:hypothetical protein n=1 Tax=Methanothrix sp. TaxID=90426 RepID=UPI00257C41DB|nr:hypothetical protein [Methanothrix sp.]NPU87143.1 hypothetical protein [Methanothrix sp.]